MPVTPLFLPFPKVPVIPVVYSSFTTFYNPKTKLFTSGNKESLGDRVAVVLCGDLAHKGVGGKQSWGELEEPCWEMFGGSSKHLAPDPGLG